jgi:hypothetical protein
MQACALAWYAQGQQSISSVLLVCARISDLTTSCSACCSCCGVCCCLLRLLSIPSLARSIVLPHGCSCPFFALASILLLNLGVWEKLGPFFRFLGARRLSSLLNVPRHRWIIIDGVSGVLVAHLAAAGQRNPHVQDGVIKPWTQDDPGGMTSAATPQGVLHLPSTCLLSHAYAPFTRSGSHRGNPS